jgi:hypothetical protein
MPNNIADEQAKTGISKCKVCRHPGAKEIDTMILNGTGYPAIVARMRQVHPGEPALAAPALSRHKTNHLLNNPITREVVGEDGVTTIQTYVTGQYESQNLVIPPEAIPQIPSLIDSLKVIIAAGLHNVLVNPGIVTPDKLLAALVELRKAGGGTDDLNTFLGAWDNVGKAKKDMQRKAKTIRTVTVSETVTADLPSDAIEGEWSATDLDALALPPGPAETA